MPSCGPSSCRRASSRPPERSPRGWGWSDGPWALRRQRRRPGWGRGRGERTQPPTAGTGPLVRKEFPEPITDCWMEFPWLNIRSISQRATGPDAGMPVSGWGCCCVRPALDPQPLPESRAPGPPAFCVWSYMAGATSGDVPSSHLAWSLPASEKREKGSEMTP